MQFFYRDNKALDAICPVNVTPVSVGLFLKILIFFDENITGDKFGHVLNRRKIGCGEE
jgi:hypothetical protein